MSCVNLVGLFLNLVGTMLIWYFGLPPSVDRRGRTSLITHEVDLREIGRAKRMDLFSKIGMGSIVLGFALQVVAAVRA